MVDGEKNELIAYELHPGRWENEMLVFLVAVPIRLQRDRS